jgi:hypothetical protein
VRTGCVCLVSRLRPKNQWRLSHRCPSAPKFYLPCRPF